SIDAVSCRSADSHWEGLVPSRGLRFCELKRRPPPREADARRRTRPSSTSSCREVRRTRIWWTSSRMRLLRFGASSCRLRPMSPFVDLAPKMITSTWADPGQPGFLGPAHAPFLPNAEGKTDMVLNANISGDRFGTRQSLLKNFDTLRRDVDASGMWRGMDKFTEQAFGILTSSKLAE